MRTAHEIIVPQDGGLHAVFHVGGYMRLNGMAARTLDTFIASGCRSRAEAVQRLRAWIRSGRKTLRIDYQEEQ